MDNFRRILFTKSEVKQLGLELTAQTTDPIKVLYLPIDSSLVEGISMYFDYWSSTTNSQYYKLATSGSKTMTINNSNSEILLSSTNLSFQYKSSGTYQPKLVIWYKSMPHIYHNGNHVDSGYIVNDDFFDTHNENVSDTYLRLDLTKMKFNLLNTDITGQFFIKYRSGDVPADTIYYEPGTYE